MTSVSIWDLPERGARGPKPRLDRAVIAATAVRIADAGGLDALTMRKVAGALGIATMSLYNYVPAKDHLAQLMIDHLASEYTYPKAPGGAAGTASGGAAGTNPGGTPGAGAPDRRAAIVELAGQARDIARRHPWLSGLLNRPVPPGPNGLRYLDYFLGLLAGTDLDTGAKLEAIAMISGFATMYGGMQTALASQGSGGASPPEQAREQAEAQATEQTEAQIRAFARAAASGQYPNLAAALAVAGPVRSEEDVFESCVLRLVDGFVRGEA